MGNDLIAVVNVLKSARVGYTKMLVANKGYKIQHKKRNVLSWCPTDPDADTMMTTEVQVTNSEYTVQMWNVTDRGVVIG
ncbi:phage terminase large subunit family protein [Pseudomonas lurida]|uniref:phage terminase large subunit family protein n=1 Tax=Pseudomonas lurida TaxID=244566 RepID=UPI003F68309D